MNYNGANYVGGRLNDLLPKLQAMSVKLDSLHLMLPASLHLEMHNAICEEEGALDYLITEMACACDELNAKLKAWVDGSESLTDEDNDTTDNITQNTGGA